MHPSHPSSLFRLFRPAPCGGFSVASLTILAAVAFAAPPEITQQPQSQVVNPGAAVTLSVVSRGEAPLAYQWHRLGLSIPSLPPTTTTTATSSPTVASVAAAASSLLPTLELEWLKLSTPIPGATDSRLDLSSVQVRDSGRYLVVVSNASGRTVSRPASLAVIPNELRAQHSFPLLGNVVVAPDPRMSAANDSPLPLLPPVGYLPGGTIRVDCQLSYPAPITGLTWRVTLPEGWSLAGMKVLTTGAGEVRAAQPDAGATGTLEWRWTAVPANPYGFRFAYELKVPSGATGAQSLAAVVQVQMEGRPGATLPVQPNPLLIPKAGDGRRFHSADTDKDGRISLAELTRLLQLFNARNGPNRTGAYTALAGTEDGFASDADVDPKLSRLEGDYHSADTNLDGKLSLMEITRVVELFNTRERGARTGAYHAEPGSEDTFGPGP